MYKKNGEEVLDITTTATIRPSLFHQTLKSFTDKLFINQKDYRLILNVDPIGEDVDPIEVVKVGQQFFDNVVYNIPDKPNFAQACKWCWGQTYSRFVFHLEDDWTMVRRINIGEMLLLINNNNDMMYLRLPKLTLHMLKDSDYKNGFIKHHKILLNPAIFRGNFVREISKKMNIIDNPEKQLRKVFKLNKDKIAGIYCGIGDGEYLKHHGRKWQRTSNYKKVKGSNFITWEKRDK